MADKGKKRLSPEQWKALRAAWCAGKRDHELAAEFGCTRQTIIAHRASDAGRGDPWILTANHTLSNAAISDSVKSETRSKVIDMATRQAMSQPEIQKAQEDAAREIAEELLATYAIAREAATSVKSLFVGINAGTFKPAERVGQQNQAQFLNDALGTLSKFTNVVRLGYGIMPGHATIATDDGSERPDRIVFEIDFGPSQPTGTDGADPYGPEKT